MEFINEFIVPLDPAGTLAILTNLERVAPCMPGAVLKEVEGDEYRGIVKVKVGPMSLTYGGTARLVEVDTVANTARIDASGREQRGAGTAAADVRARLEADGEGQTRVTVVTDLRVTGKPAQFGRGVMGEVGARIIDRFAENLKAELHTDRSGQEESGDGADGLPVDTTATHGQRPEDHNANNPDAGAEDANTSVPMANPKADIADATAHAEVTSAGPRPIVYTPPRDEALDLLDVAGPAAARRLVPTLAMLVAVITLVLLRRRRRN